MRDFAQLGEFNSMGRVRQAGRPAYLLVEPSVKVSPHSARAFVKLFEFEHRGYPKTQSCAEVPCYVACVAASTPEE
jgi:hypothetical protein